MDFVDGELGAGYRVTATTLVKGSVRGDRWWVAPGATGFLGQGGRAVAIQVSQSIDATPLLRQGKKGSPDGFAVDRDGNLLGAGPGGIVVISPAGRLLGTIPVASTTSNCAFGDDGSMLYITADMDLLRIRLNTKGARF